MPVKEAYDKTERDPSSGMDFTELLARYGVFDLQSPYEMIAVPTAWLMDPRITDRQKIALLILNSYCDEEGVITATRRQLQVFLHCKKQSVVDTLRTLQELGYIERIDGINGGRPTYRMLDPTPKIRKLPGKRKK